MTFLTPGTHRICAMVPALSTDRTSRPAQSPLPSSPATSSLSTGIWKAGNGPSVTPPAKVVREMAPTVMEVILPEMMKAEVTAPEGMKAEVTALEGMKAEVTAPEGMMKAEVTAPEGMMKAEVTALEATDPGKTVSSIWLRVSSIWTIVEGTEAAPV